MRTRHGSTLTGTVSVTSENINTHVVTQYGSYGWSTAVGTFEEIIDEGGKKQFLTLPHGGKTPKMKSVSHGRYDMSVVTSDHEVMTSAYSLIHTNGLVICELDKGIGNMGEWLIGKWRDHVVESPFSRSLDRWNAVKPTMTTRANAAVFLAELRDVKRMFELLPKRHFNSSWQELFTSKKRGWRWANGLHLNYNFGWKPFIRDVQAFWRAYGDFDARLTKFIQNQNRDLRRHRGESPATVALSYVDACPGGPWQLNCTINATRRCSSTFEFYYSLPIMTMGELRWRSWLDSLGLNPSIANVWALIPWSFVVDWFWRVGKCLDQATTDWVEPWVQFIQACSSFKASGDISASLYLPASGARISLGSAQCTLYKRFPGMPQFSGSTQTLDADKVRLLVSLGASLL